VLAREGVTESIGRIEATLMAEADLQGVLSHGVRMLPGLVKAIRDGRCKANPQLVVTRKRGATCVLSKHAGLGIKTAPARRQPAGDGCAARERPSARRPGYGDEPGGCG
jgi:LDH2 family malate/lactate/ureidoglycolate dehydrogenase